MACMYCMEEPDEGKCIRDGCATCCSCSREINPESEDTADAPPVPELGGVPNLKVKQVLVYRRDLKMRKGKIAAQCAHASMKVFFDRANFERAMSDDGETTHWMDVDLTPEMAHWAEGLFGKIVLSVANEEDLLRCFEEAKARGLPAALIVDAGRTEFHGVPTRTTVAIGPAEADEIDTITGPGGLVETKLA